MSLKSNLSSKLAALKKPKTAITNTQTTAPNPAITNNQNTVPKSATPAQHKIATKKSCGEVGFVSSKPQELQEHASLLKNWDGVATKELFPVKENSSADIERLNRLADGKEESPIIKNRMYHNCIDPVVLEEAAKIFPVGTNAWKHILSGARGKQFERFAKACKGNKNLAHTIVTNPDVTEELIDDALSISYEGDPIAYSILEEICFKREWLIKASVFFEKENMNYTTNNLLPFAIKAARNGQSLQYIDKFDFSKYEYDYACAFLLSVLTLPYSLESFKDFVPKLKLNGISVTP